MNKKILLFGILPVLVLSLVAAGAIFYNMFLVTVYVNQPITVTGDLTQSVPCDAGDTCTGEQAIMVTNTGDKDEVVIVTDNSGDNIDVSYVGKLLLENKDSEWNLMIEDNIKADLVYSVVGEKFGYELKATGLVSYTSYSLIYYADKPERFVDWGGNNPGAMIVTATSDDAGNLVVEGSVDLDMNLPSPNDANIDQYDYSVAPDNYDYAHGAKIWLVKTSDLPTTYPSENAWAFWSASGILFETELVWYSDSANELTVPANSFIEFYPQFAVNQHASDGPRTIEITVA